MSVETIFNENRCVEIRVFQTEEEYEIYKRVFYHDTDLKLISNTRVFHRSFLE